MRYIISGLGRMGRLHKQVADSLGWECVAIADPRINSFSHEMNIEGILKFKSLAEIPAEIGFDALVLAATTPARVGDLEWSFAHPVRHLTITEKPFANSVNEAHRLSQMAFDRKMPVGVNHPRPFTSLYRHVRKIIETNELGRLHGMQVAGSNWGLGNNTIHFVELASYLYGERPSAVSAWFDEELVPSPRGKKFWDFSGRVLVDFKKCNSLFVDFRNNLAHGKTITLSFEQGQVVVDERRGNLAFDTRSVEDFDLPTWKRVGSNYRQITVGPEPAEKGMRELYQSVIGRNWIDILNRSVWAVETVAAAYVSHIEHRGARVMITEVPAPYNSHVFPWA